MFYSVYFDIIISEIHSRSCIGQDNLSCMTKSSVWGNIICQICRHAVFGVEFFQALFYILNFVTRLIKFSKYLKWTLKKILFIVESSRSFLGCSWTAASLVVCIIKELDVMETPTGTNVGVLPSNFFVCTLCWIQFSEFMLQVLKRGYPYTLWCILLRR